MKNESGPTTIEKPKEERISEDILSMYVVPGYEREYTEHSLERYRRESNRLKKRLSEAAQTLTPGDFSVVDEKEISYILAVAEGDRKWKNLVAGIREKLAFSVHDSKLPIETGDADSGASEPRLHSGNLLLWAETIWALETSEMEAAENQLSRHISECFVNGGESMVECAKAIWYAKESDRDVLISIGFRTGDPKVTSECAKAIECAEITSRTRLISEGLDTGDTATMIECVGLIWYASEEESGALVRKAIATGNRPVVARCMDIIPIIRDEEGRSELYASARKILGDEFFQGPLYRKVPEEFGRLRFAKTGSDTVLIGRIADSELKGRVIVRRLDLRNFLAWKRLYDDYESWRDNGFAYVPVEPIVSFSIRENGIVDAYTGVLDMSLEEWEGISGDFVPDLETDARLISDIVSGLGIVHGHMEKKNFCLRFHRSADGRVDTSVKPRLYLIDFDQARMTRRI